MSELDVRDIKELILISCNERIRTICLSYCPTDEYVLYIRTDAKYEKVGYYKDNRFIGRLFGPTEAEIIGYVYNSIRKQAGIISMPYTEDTIYNILVGIDACWPGVVNGVREEIDVINAGKLRKASIDKLKESFNFKPLRYEHCDPQVVWKGEADKADFLAKYMNIPMEGNKPKAVDCCGTNSFPIANNLMDQLRDAIKEDMRKETEKSLYLSYPRKNGKSLYLDAMLDAIKYYKYYSKETKNMKREIIREEKPQTFENIVREAYYYPSFFDLSALEATDVFIKVDDELRTIYMVVEGENELKSKKTVLNIFTGKLEKMDNETKVHLFDIDEVKFVTGRFVTDTKKAEHEEV